jgi:hypothetical protein
VSYRMGTLGSFPGDPCLSMHVVYGMFFESLNTEFGGRINTINICLILSTFTFLFLSVVV